MTDKNEENKLVIPKAPRPKSKQIQKKISKIKLIEVDGDEEDYIPESIINYKEISQNNQKSNEKEKYNDGYISDDRYEDSSDLEYGDGCETNPDSGQGKIL